MFRYRVDDSRLPLAIFESPGKTPGADIDQESFYAELDRLLEKRVPFATLHDMTGSEPDAARRRRFTTWTEANHDVLKIRLIAHAVVLDSAVLAHILTGVLWMTRTPCPMKVFSDRKEAEAWLVSECDARRKREASA